MPSGTRNSTVIIIAPQEDAHARSVSKRIKDELNSNCLVLDPTCFLKSWSISFYCDESAYFEIITESVRLSSHEISGLWWRRYTAPSITDEVTDPRVQSFCIRESKRLLHGALNSLGSRVINPVYREAEANCKPFQLSVARDVGLRTPDTVVSNTLSDVIGLFDAVPKEVVFKILSTTDLALLETRVIDRGSVKANADSLRLAPAIFQEAIIPKIDLRSTVIDDEVFTAVVRESSENKQLDWRLDMAAAYEKYSLSRETELKLVALTRALGLRYGAIDLCVNEHGDEYFLEINPSGQFLFIEIHADLPISLAFAKALVGNHRQTDIRIIG